MGAAVEDQRGSGAGGVNSTEVRADWLHILIAGALALGPERSGTKPVKDTG